ncbi:membrane protein [Thermosipho melanesiensis]|uniref:MMPL domain protein n=2 Tax=Thermosipho melanesiensis TaxID=46541 RepID=A6LLS8_THEM4|nr:MMPL family transporter [Thermosipho melanesiensis]ABR30879.1 MMPL domain protein [Thermosipho melanesiensis BI429]APT73998.1 membrane protein [Thermosipho melanesiensis]OOC35928.1 membrane protein [Thermosipho melanesiensis]OOC38430.1 membrane protein [Thermosipho melanesiensis]OOC38891.1 membrane protein [Thermosipho melanesiensis]
MERLGRFVQKHAFWIILVTFLLTIFFGYQIRNLEVKDDITKYPPKDDPLVKKYESLADEFGINSMVMVGFEIDSFGDLEKIDNLTLKVGKTEGVEHVTSLTNIPLVVKTENGIEVSTVSEMLKARKVEPKELLKYKTLKDKFISSDARAGLMLVSLEEGKESETFDSVKALIESNYDKGVHFYGISAVNQSVKEITLRNLLKLVPISLFIVVLILTITFRKLTGALLPILGVVISVIWTMGLIVLFGFKITIANSVIPVALISIGTAYSIHVVNKYYEEKGDRGERAIYTLRDVGMAVLLSGITTAVGFLSLLTADIKPVWVMGIFSSVGVMLCNFIALFFVPSMLYYINPPAIFHIEKRHSKLDLKPKFTLIVLLVLVVLTIPFLFRIKTDMDIINSINKNERIIVDKKFIEKSFGGCDYIFIDIQGDFKDPGVLMALNEIEKRLKGVKGVVNTFSIVDTMLDLSKAFTGFYSIPFSKEELSNLWFFLQGNETIYSVVNKQLNRGIIQVTVKVESESETRRLIDDIDNILNQVPKGFRLERLPDFNYYASALNVDVKKLKRAYDEVKSLSFSDIAKLHVGDILSAISNVEELMGEELKDKEGVLKDILKVMHFSEEAFENTLRDLDLGYLLYNELYVPYKMWKSQVFAEKLGVDYTEKTEQYLKIVSEEQIYVPSKKETYSAIHTGAQEIALYVSDLLFKNQYQSMFLTLLVVFFLLFLQMKSLRIGLIGIIPSIFTVYFNFVLMGAFNIPLNTATISIAAIAIGAGVDYAIHYISRYKIERQRVKDDKEAVVRTIFTSGRGIIFNAFAVSFGFFTFVFSDIKMLKQFGVLTGITLILSAILTIVFLSSVFLLKKEGGRV